MTDDEIRKRIAAAEYRKAKSRLDAATKRRDQVPEPTAGEPKHVTARRARAALGVNSSAIGVVLTSNAEIVVNLPAAAGKKKKRLM